MDIVVFDMAYLQDYIPKNLRHIIHDYARNKHYDNSCPLCLSFSDQFDKILRRQNGWYTKGNRDTVVTIVTNGNNCNVFMDYSDESVLPTSESTGNMTREQLLAFFVHCKSLGNLLGVYSDEPNDSDIDEETYEVVKVTHQLYEGDTNRLDINELFFRKNKFVV
jgi:hypothetical protein